MDRVSKAERELVRKMQRQTNADFIRSMTDEELAEFLNQTQGRAFGNNMMLSFQWLDWLRQEARE